MAKDRNGSAPKDEAHVDEDQGDGATKSKRKKDESRSERNSSDSDDDRHRRSSKKKKKTRHGGSSRRRSRDSDGSSSSSDSDSYSDSESESSSEGSESDGSGSRSEMGEEETRRRRKRRERKRREREYEKERKRKKEKKRKREKEERKKKKKEKKKDKKKKKEKDLGKKGAVTNSWGKYGIIKETDMWNKRPEFTAWLLEVKQVNLETLANWEEKQMFKEFMEDHNTATFPSKKYYNLDAYHRQKIEKAMKKGMKKVAQRERTIFDDEEERRLELLRERERQKEEQVEALKCSMQSGMAQAMKEQARLREEMAYQYRLGNFEAAAAIQKRLDPDIAM